MIVVDTHAWLWWMAAPAKLSRRARQLIDDADAIGVCTISCWELAMLAERSKIVLDRDVRIWVGQALNQEHVEPLVLTPEIAVSAALLDRDGFPGDPADRIIYASVLSREAQLVSKDVALRDFDRRRVVW